MFGFNRVRAINYIIKFVRQIPDCAAERLALLPQSNKPDIICVIRGRAIFLKVIPKGQTPSQAQIDACEPFQLAGARIVFVRDDPARVLDIIAQVAEEQDRIYAYDPRKDLR